jgi:phenylalanyl-tRNA synthetase alpha chain
MDIKKLIEGLHVLERKVLPLVPKVKSFDELVKKSGLQPVEVMRALQWMQNKKIINVKEELKEVIELDKFGKEYAKSHLPERRFLLALKKPSSVDNVKNKLRLSKDELNLCLGLLRKKAAIAIIKKDNKLYVKLLQPGIKMMEKESLEEKFLKKSFPVELKSLKDEERYAFDQLKRRKGILKTKLLKLKHISLTPLGKEIIKKGIKEGKVIDRLTSDMLKKNTWKGKTFRRYDVKINVPEISGGKRHFVKQAIEYGRKIWLELGFKEMQGPIINTSFWNFDALFTAQDHPVRELQDTFYLSEPEKGKLASAKLVKEVKAVHENGGKTGSAGWQYEWNEEEAKKNVLRTHTTVLSALTLAKLKKEEMPAKFFSFGRCYRNEAVDWSHLFEFNQTDGIVIGEDVSFRHLLGYLKEFFKKMGFEKARFRPAHFPYTEPSVEIDVYHPIKKQWIELGGAGMFRPELIVPLLGKEIPVLAWGPGFDRMVMDYYKINDARDLYKNDIKQMRQLKIWMK